MTERSTGIQALPGLARTRPNGPYRRRRNGDVA
jgi:hypothetical protein